MTASCKICWGDDNDGVMVSPCACSGSMKFVHVSCLVHWLCTTKDSSNSCDICFTNFKIQLPSIVPMSQSYQEPLPLSLKIAMLTMWTYTVFIMMLPFIVVRH